MGAIGPASSQHARGSAALALAPSGISWYFFILCVLCLIILSLFFPPPITSVARRVADYENRRLALWRLSNDTVWKHLGTEQGQFSRPQAVAVTGAGALVVTDQYRVRVLTVDGAFLYVLDLTAVLRVGSVSGALFGVALYPGTDEILVTDYDYHRVVALSWSPEVCCFRLCLHPAGFLVDVSAL